MELRRELGLLDLTLFNISAVVGIRWLAAAAHTGPGVLTLWLVAALLFFVPSALAVASLSRRFPQQGGLYVWTQQAFGPWHGFLCGYCYWLSNVFYFPNLALAGVSMTGAAVGLREGDVQVAALLVVWLVLMFNYFGLGVSKWISNLAGAATYSTGMILVVAGLATLIAHGSASRVTIWPEASLEKLNFWSQIAFAFGGLELGAVLAGEIRSPQHTIARAAWTSGLIITGFYILGTLALLVLVPSSEISMLNGLIQAGQAIGKQWQLPMASGVFATLACLSIAGQLGSWMAGAARIPYVAGIHHLLPPSFSQLHPRWRTPYVAILTQGALSTIFLVAMNAGENLKAGYQILVDMTVILYFIPFGYLFAAAWKGGQRLAGACGMLVTGIALVLTLVPPPGVSSVAGFELKLLGGAAVLIAFARGWFLRFSASRTPPVLATRDPQI
ncbi:MAG: APC family permease [Bryobacteraceae bacterium]|nr:APC family permease [Bryobacteraceae bacterium]MDW8376953.1 APC family permease [Bryobacterales bacterium]